MTWTTPVAAPAGAALTSTFWDAQVKDNLDVIGGAWTSYTPTVGGWTLGNGVLAAAYAQAGKWMRFRIKLTVKSTTVTGASLTFSLPVTPHADYLGSQRWIARDVSAAAEGYGDSVIYGGTATILLRSTSPFTWATDDYIGVAGEVELA